ncbi:MAG: diguanylate cyclase [Porphyrobacter sp. IPPAS B-1204]|nr:MAG: diguanylate cyclase [Porphyrobacter sp. IPPAS B-1204]
MGMAVPLELAVALCAICAGLGSWAGQALARRRLDPRRPSHNNPLGDLLKPSVLAEAVDMAARRSSLRSGPHAVLHGRIDQFAALHPAWNAQTRDEVRAHIAAVMRAGLRRGDRIALAESAAGGGFTILVPGADERAAVHIADRLRRALGQLRLPQIGSAAHLTASFGVAADRFGDNIDVIDQRARRALDSADCDHVVPASDIEEIMLLPAPTPTAAPAASAA